MEEVLRLSKVTLLHERFSRFLNSTNGTKLRNAPHISIDNFFHKNIQFDVFVIKTVLLNVFPDFNRKKGEERTETYF